MSRLKCEMIDGMPLFCDVLWRRIRRDAPASNRACGLWVAFGWVEGQESKRPTLHGAILREHAKVGPAILINYCPFCGERIRARTEAEAAPVEEPGKEPVG